MLFCNVLIAMNFTTAYFTHRIPARFPQYSREVYDDSFVEMQDPEEEAKWRTDCAKYVADRLVPLLEKRNAAYKLDVVAYETNNSFIG